MESYWLLFGVIVVAFLAVLIGGRRKRWYKVSTALPATMLLYRTSADWWLRGNSRHIIFRNEQGKIVGFPALGHWILMYQEVDEKDIDVVRQEIENERLAKANV